MIKRAARQLSAALFLWAVLIQPAQADKVTVITVSFADLTGWGQDDHSAALAVFVQSCGKLRENTFTLAKDWAAPCAYARKLPKSRDAARTFFELFFQPVLIKDERSTLFTAYYEPELIASRTRGGKYQYPIYKRPPEVVQGRPWKTRAQIENGALKGRNLELAWLADPVENFFLHIQGSGRLKLNTGGFMRVGFDGKNGHPYRSVGKEMVRQGILSKSRASADRIKDWVRRNPKNGRQLLQHNLSYIFFREVKTLTPKAGPIGAMDVSVTTLRSLAVDPKYTPLGAPVWIAKSGTNPLNRLMVAQDTGSAIKGAQRADIFFGTGAKAGHTAGRIKDGGQMYVLLPVASVRRLLPKG